MRERGITLVEVITAVSAVGILSVLSYVSFDNWLARYKAEKATGELYADMMEARAAAMAECREHFIVMGRDSYTMYEDRNDDGDPDADEALPAFPKKVEYPLQWNGTGNRVTFDRRGTATSDRTIWFQSRISPDYDCMRVSTMRIILGKAKYYGDGSLDECVVYE